MSGRAEKSEPRERGSEPNPNIHMTSHNVYFATRIYDLQTINDTPPAGEFYAARLKIPHARVNYHSQSTPDIPLTTLDTIRCSKTL